MKLYDDSPTAPNPRRVRWFLAEKGVEVPLENVDIMKGEHRTEDYRAKSPMGQVPALELDDGRVVTESAAIQRYFEELHPTPALLGSTPEERAVIGMWDRRLELYLFMPIATSFRHLHPAMAKLENQIAEWGKECAVRGEKMFRWLDKMLDGRDYVAGDAFSVADITGVVAVDFGKFARVKIPEECKRVQAWYERVSARPAAKA